MDELFLKLLKEDYERRCMPILTSKDLLWSWLQKEGEKLGDGLMIHIV